jgi:hypothetical protein
MEEGGHPFAGAAICTVIVMHGKVKDVPVELYTKAPNLKFRVIVIGDDKHLDTCRARAARAKSVDSCSFRPK